MSRLIDADALWEKMYKYSDNEGAKMPYGDDDSLIHRDSACFLIEEAPTIDLEPHWIPVTERLPEVGQDVMFSVHDVYSAEGCLRPDGDWWQFRWETVIPKERVTAWCELPEPFKGVTE